MPQIKTKTASKGRAAKAKPAAHKMQARAKNAKKPAAKLTALKAAKLKAAKNAGKKPGNLVVRHTKRIIRLTPKFVHGMVIGAFIGIVLVTMARSGATAAALSLNSPRDCDNNSVIHCGALSTTELQAHYTDAGVAAIYSYFGITATDIQDIGSTAAAGLVYKNGTVAVNGKTVATDAITVGRQNIAGSKQVTSGGVTFYTRPPGVSFNTDSIAAYVVMNGGQFQFAILASCANAVIGTPVPQPKPAPTPSPQPLPAPAPTPGPTPTPTPTPPIPTIKTASVVNTLPNTGPGAIFIIAILSVIGGATAHATHHHLKRRRQARHHTPHPHHA